jgi:hypothetical protein
MASCSSLYDATGNDADLDKKRKDAIAQHLGRYFHTVPLD